VPPIRVAVIGAGAFGRNHLRVYRELEQAHPNLVQLAALVEPNEARRHEYATLYNIPTFPTVEDLLAPESGGPSFRALGERVGSSGGPDESPHLIDAASICVPTIHHAAVATQLLQAHLDILIEKPIAASLAEADAIISLAQQNNRIVAVGHLERFNPAVTAVTSRLNNPMFFEAHRLSIFTPRSLDVDVVLDLMIHDLDIVLSLTNSPVREVRAVGIAILSKKADIANVRVEFESGCVANFTASRVSTEQVRKLRLFQPHQYLSLDFARQELLTISVDPRAAAALAAMSASKNIPATPSDTPGTSSLQPQVLSHPQDLGTPSLQARVSLPSQEKGALAPEGTPTHPSAGLNLQKLDLPHAEPLRLELEDFLQAITTRTQPRVNATAARAALALALEINQEIATHAHRAGLT
jgi:predicted dehydrogenase